MFIHMPSTSPTLLGTRRVENREASPPTVVAGSGMLFGITASLPTRRVASDLLGSSPNKGIAVGGSCEDLHQPDLPENGCPLVGLRSAYALQDRRTDILLTGHHICDQVSISDAGTSTVWAGASRKLPPVLLRARRASAPTHARLVFTLWHVTHHNVHAPRTLASHAPRRHNTGNRWVFLASN